jgi:hypothetical protein
MGAITTMEKCVARVMMNWLKKFVKQFLVDYSEAQ